MGGVHRELSESAFISGIQWRNAGRASLQVPHNAPCITGFVRRIRPSLVNLCFVHAVVGGNHLVVR